MISVKRCGPADCKEVLGLRKRLYLESNQAKNNGHVSPTQEWRAFYDVLGFLLDPYSIVLMAQDDGKPVGMLAIHQQGITGFYKEPCVTVTWIYIDPEYRGGTVALSLIRKAEAAVIAKNGVTVQATIRADNTEMLESAHKLGYTPVALIVEKQHGRGDFRSNPGAAVHQEGSRDVAGSPGGAPARSELPARS